MLRTSKFQVTSQALDLASALGFSEQAHQLLVSVIAHDLMAFDYRDVVAALAVSTYRPELFNLILKRFRICTDEIYYKIIERGYSTENALLLRAFWAKPRTHDVYWTFFDG